MKVNLPYLFSFILILAIIDPPNLAILLKQPASRATYCPGISTDVFSDHKYRLSLPARKFHDQLFEPSAQLYTFLPITVNLMTWWFFEGLDELEPNNTCKTANGPIHARETYVGNHNDKEDWFNFYSSKTGKMAIRLNSVNMEDGRVQVHLYQACQNWLGYGWLENKEVLLTGDVEEGWYSLKIYVDQDYLDEDKEYNFSVSFPSDR